MSDSKLIDGLFAIASLQRHLIDYTRMLRGDGKLGESQSWKAGAAVERKSFAFEVKDVSEAGVVRGYAAVIGNVDDGGDRIMPGAFDKSIARSKGVMPIFWGHAWDRIPLGYGTEARADSRGLYVTGEFTMAVGDSKAALSSIKHAKEVGFPIGISIGYRIAPKGSEMVGGVRELREVDVFEWSLTPFPMNKRARVTSIGD